MKNKPKARIMKGVVALFAVILFSANAAYGQMARWAMRPGYDSIRLAAGVPVVISDSAGVTSLWSTDAKLLASTEDSIAKFSEGMAVVMKKGIKDITGFYATDGTFTKLENCKVVYNCPYFRDGYLLVNRQGRNKLVAKDGSYDPFGSFVTMYPYCSGYACCTMYGDMENFKDLYYYYVDTDKNLVKLMLDKKEAVENEDVSFLSSLNDDGVGIAVIKHRVYMFDKGLGMLRPVFVDEKAEKKRQVRVGDFSECMYNKGDSTILWARGSKRDTVFFAFDERMRLVSVKYPARTVNYNAVQTAPLKLKGDFTAERGGNGMYAVKSGSSTILPPQFDGAGISFGKFIAVRKDGKWGLLQLDEKLKYSMSMNKGNAIAFRHKKFETTVRLDLPAEIKADGCSFDIPAGNGCTVDKTSVQMRNTSAGNFVQYNCVLTIPDSLPDHITEITYPVSMTCDGISYPDSKLTVKAWHYKYVNMDLSREEIKFERGIVEFILNMTADKLAGENDYPLTVQVVEDSTAARVDLIKLSETRYKCLLYSPVEGINRLVVSVIENGCPPSYFPFEINYIKPKDNAAAGQVEITKSGTVQTTGAAAPAVPATTAAPAVQTTTETSATPVTPGTVTVPPAPVQQPNTMPTPTAQSQTAAGTTQTTTAPATTQTPAPAATATQTATTTTAPVAQ